MKPKFTDLFNRFAGREVNREDKNDPTIQEMKKVAADKGLTLRVLFPDTMVTEEYMFRRVNARVEKGADGKWRIGRNFNMG